MYRLFVHNARVKVLRNLRMRIESLMFHIESALFRSSDSILAFEGDKVDSSITEFKKRSDNNLVDMRSIVAVLLVGLVLSSLCWAQEDGEFLDSWD